jgi:hypothetical protein
MEKIGRRDIIFNIIEKYHGANGDLDKFGIHEHLISNGIDLSDEVLKERIKNFKDETSKDDKEKNKNP